MVGLLPPGPGNVTGRLQGLQKVSRSPWDDVGGRQGQEDRVLSFPGPKSLYFFFFNPGSVLAHVGCCVLTCGCVPGQTPACTLGWLAQPRQCCSA